MGMMHSPLSGRGNKYKKNKISVAEFIDKVSTSDIAQPNILIN